MPKVSFIIPFYNTKIDILHLCFDSIKKQSFEDYEVIVVNDGSEPSLACQGKKLYEDYRFMGHFITTSNHGVSEARNRGVLEAAGEYVSFVDSDDIVDIDFYKTLFDFSDRLPDYIASEYINVPYDINNYSLNGRDIPGFDFEIIPSKILKRHFLGSYECDGGGWAYIGSCPYAKLVKRDLAIRHPFDPSLDFGEDTLWNLSVLSDIDKVGVVKLISYGVHEHLTADSLSTKYRKSIVQDITRFIVKVGEKYVSEDEMKDYARLAVIWAYAMFRNQAILSLKDAITDELRLALSADPWNSLIEYSTNCEMPVRYKIFSYFLRHRIYWGNLLIAKAGRAKATIRA